MSAQPHTTEKLGIVLLLDEPTHHRTLELAAHNNEGSSIHLGAPHIPHVTLYHANLKDIARPAVSALLEEISRMLPLPLSFFRIAVFKKFLLWDVERSEELVAAHERALTLSRYFPADEQEMSKEHLALSPQEISHIQMFGSSLVRDLWRPHVTLCHYPEGIAREDRTETFMGTASAVAFVRVGEAGTIAEIIEQR